MSTAAELLLRDYVHDAIEAAQNASELSNNDFTLSKQYAPFTDYDDIPDDGTMFVILLASGSGDQDQFFGKASRGRAMKSQVRVNLIFQAKAKVDEITKIDGYVQLCSDIRDVIRDLTNLKTANMDSGFDDIDDGSNGGVLYAKEKLWEQGIFESSMILRFTIAI